MMLIYVFDTATPPVPRVAAALWAAWGGRGGAPVSFGTAEREPNFDRWGGAQLFIQSGVRNSLPAYGAELPSSSSMRNSWLYL